MGKAGAGSTGICSRGSVREYVPPDPGPGEYNGYNGAVGEDDAYDESEDEEEVVGDCGGRVRECGRE
jgi:hypothetical protein